MTTKAATKKTPSSTTFPVSNAAQSLEDRIRARAYELYLQRDRQDGFAEQDWRQAEAELTPASRQPAA